MTDPTEGDPEASPPVPGYERCGHPKRDKLRPEVQGQPCGKPAGWGTDHAGFGNCRLHLGNTSSHVAAARQEAAAVAVATYGLRRDVDPLSALLEEVQWTAGHVEWLRGKVQEHADGDLVWGMTEQKSGEETTTTHKAAPNVWLALYQAERKHLTAVCGEAIRSGVAERTVQLEERRGELLAGGLRWLLGALVLSPVQVVQVPELVPRMLRALASGDLAALPAGGGG